MLLVDSYTYGPGSCRLCRSSKHTPVIDTEQTIDDEGWEGHLYICVACVEEMADRVGWVSPEKYQKAKTESSRLRRRNDALREQFDGALAAVTEMFTPDADEDDE